MRGLALATLLTLSAVPAFAAGEQKMTFKVQHHFTRIDARARTQMMLDYWHQAYGVTSRWEGDRVYLSGRVVGVQIDAYIDVTDDSVAGEGSDPGPLMRSLARNYVQKKLLKYMQPDYREP